MFFRFCNGDCPDWVLAEIHSNLSSLSSVKLKILTQMVAKQLILGEDINEEKLKDTFSSTLQLKSGVACLRFLLTNATRFLTDTIVFNEEVQQLGLPKEHATVICRVLSENSNDLREILAKQSLKVNEFEDITYEIPEDAINYAAQLNIKIKNEIINGVPQNSEHKILVTKNNIKILLNEMNVIKNIMEKFDEDKK